MNYGEELAYWYLRLNGFFPISNFVIHRSTLIQHASDIDVLAIRPPHVYEEIGGQPDDWDQELARLLDFGRFVGVICEVKTGRFDKNRLFRNDYVEYALGRLGLVNQEELSDFAAALSTERMIEGPGFVIVKLLVSELGDVDGPFVVFSQEHVEEFIEGRVSRYPNEKYADRMYFGSQLFQHTIHRIHKMRAERDVGMYGSKT